MPEPFEALRTKVLKEVEKSEEARQKVDDALDELQLKQESTKSAVRDLHDDNERRAALGLRTDTIRGEQPVAVSGSSIVGICYVTKAKTLNQSVSVGCHTVAASGESLVVDVKRVRKGVSKSMLKSPITIDDTIAAQTAVFGVLDKSDLGMIKGDYIYADVTYVPGGIPTPLKNLVITMVCAY